MHGRAADRLGVSLRHDPSGKSAQDIKPVLPAVTLGHHTLAQWTDDDGPARFTQITATYSHLIGITHDGRLRTWAWADERPQYPPRDTDIMAKAIDALSSSLATIGLYE